MRVALIVGLMLVIWGLGSRGYQQSPESEDEIRGDRMDYTGIPDETTEGMPIEVVEISLKEATGANEAMGGSPKEATGDSANEATGGTNKAHPGTHGDSSDPGDDPDAADNGINDDTDDMETDVVPFAVWVEAHGYRCAGSLVSARAVLTAAVCVARAVPRGAVTVGTAAGVDATRAARAALATSGGLALLELSAALPGTRPIVHAGSEGGGCGAACVVTRGVARGGVRALPARREPHCPAALGHHAGAFCLHPVTLCQNDTGTGVTCGGKLCGVVVRSAAREEAAPGSCADSHEAASLSHWKHFLRCALDERSCHGACQSHCTEHFFNIEGTTWANEKMAKYHDVSVEGGRNAFHHVYGDRDGSRSFHHADPGGGRPYVHTVGETTHYPHNAYHPPAFSNAHPYPDKQRQQDLDIQDNHFPGSPFHTRTETNLSDVMAPGTLFSSHLEHHEAGGGGGLHAHQPGEMNELEMPRPKAIPSMTHEIPWTGDYGEMTTKPPSSPPAPPAPSLPWVARASATLGDYDMVSTPAPPVTQTPTPPATPAPTTPPPTTPPPPPTPSPTPKPVPTSTKPASTIQAKETPPPPPSPPHNATTKAPPLKISVTKLAPPLSPSPPRVPPGSPPHSPPPAPPRSPPPGLHLGPVDHNQKFRTTKPKTTEQPFPFEPLRKTHKPHYYTNQTRRITTEEIQRFDDEEALQATANQDSKGTLGSEELSPFILIAVLLTF